MVKMITVIPARGNSKGILRKNSRQFLGKPLVAWTIEAARESAVFDRVIVSTEDEEIARIGRAFGAEVPYLRPRELSEDTTPTAPVVRDTLEWLRNYDRWSPDFVMVLEPTSPGRRPFHLREAANVLQRSGADSVASVSEVPHHYVPSKVLKVQSDGTFRGFDETHPRDMIHRRQDLPKYYALNGLIFSCKTEWVLMDPPTLWGEKVLAYLVDPKYTLDLDRPEDWAPAETRLQQILLEEGE